MNHKFLKNVKRKVIKIDVSDAERRAILEEINRIFKASKGYDFYGAFGNFVGFNKAPKNDKYFCSSFVAKVLIAAGVIGDEKAYYEYRPEDFLSLNKLKNGG